MTRRARVDAELVRRGLARSRQQAAELIGAGRVSIDGMRAAKAATAIPLSANLTVEGSDERTWVSRGAHKLIGALDALSIEVDGRRCLDAGASTGGFTEVMLDRGAREVVAVDVGYGQLAWSLRTDPRVTVMERTNVRQLAAAAIGGPVDLVVADLSFISLATVLPALTACADPTGRHSRRVIVARCYCAARRVVHVSTTTVSTVYSVWADLACAHDVYLVCMPVDGGLS